MPFVRTAPVARPIHPILKAYLRQRGMGRVRGMGQTSCYDPESGTYYDCSTGATISGITDLPTFTETTPSPLSTTTVALPSATATSTTPSTLSSILSSIPSLLTSGVKTYETLQGPSLVAGTNAIYNPLTGQYYNPTTGQVVSATSGSVLGTTDLSTYMPILLIGGGLLIVAMMLGGRR